MDSCHSLVLSGLCEAPVTLKQIHGQGDAYRPSSILLWGHVRIPQIIFSSVTSTCIPSVKMHKLCVCVCVCLGTVERGKAPGRCLEPESLEPQNRIVTGVSMAGLIERSVNVLGGKKVKY